MSMIRPNGRKVVIPRCGMQEQWELLRRYYARADARKWRYLAMLALKENAGWPLECIANAFEHPKGHISRCLVSVKQELRSTFAAQDLFGLAESDDDEQLAA
jgi:hypothetical protein